jgi:hypothetical protein
MDNFKKYNLAFLFISGFLFSSLAQASFWKRCNLSDPAKLNIKSFDKCSQLQLDVFYQNLSAGRAIPNGVFDGKVQIATLSSTTKNKFFETVVNLLPDLIVEPQELLLERLWGGKIFYKKTPLYATLFNRIGSSREMFPAHVYYGRSLFDKKLSVIIDYSYNQKIEGYKPSIDWVVNEEGLAIRDEIRKVKEGLYLGRAYVRGKFLLNFVLELKN